MKEIWKIIENYEDYYISNFGNIIKNNYKSRKSKNEKIKIINPYLKSNGYLQVTLYQRKERRNCKEYVHRLVAKAFIPNINDYKCINHKNGNKLDNTVKNLEWCSYKQNMAHAFETGLCCKRYGENNKLSKKYVELDINYNFIREFIGAREENKKLGYSKDTIQRCARGKTLSTHNKIYLFKEDYVINNKYETKCNHIKRHNNYINLKNKEVE